MTPRLTRRLVAPLVAAALAVPVAGVLLTTSSAATTVPHDAIGAVRSLTATSSGLLVKGWAGDLDAATQNGTVQAVLDGKTVAASTVTSRVMPHVTAFRHLGTTPGFTMTVPVTGRHTVCIVAKSVGGGLDGVLDCVLTPLTRTATSTFDSPRGAIAHGSASRNAISFDGWADDPDDLMRPSLVTLYVDGTAVATQATTAYRWPRPAGASYFSAFAFHVPATSGAHLGCLWVTNVGLGRNTFLGCQAVDTRSQQAMTGAAPSTINAKVVTEAKKHIGQRYVWAAAGPRTFDCSGLVTYSYGKFGYTLPHQSGAQFAQARVISAAEAKPGDLVFYHDEFGSVFHVGIYLSPGMTVAAIDTQEGVNYQSIYDPTSATYGSVSHT